MLEASQFSLFSHKNNSGSQDNTHFNPGQIIEISLMALTAGAALAVFAMACVIYCMGGRFCSRQNKESALSEKTPLRSP